MDDSGSVVTFVPRAGGSRHKDGDEASKVLAFPSSKGLRPVGTRPILRCRDIAGRCCDSCHDESDGGGTPLAALFGDRGVMVALVCCLKRDEAKRRVRRPPVQRSAGLSLPSGECYR